MVVPLAVLEEFEEVSGGSVVGSSRDVLSMDEELLEDEEEEDEWPAAGQGSDFGGTAPDDLEPEHVINVRAKRTTFRQSRSKRGGGVVGGVNVGGRSLGIDPGGVTRGIIGGNSTNGPMLLMGAEHDGMSLSTSAINHECVVLVKSAIVTHDCVVDMNSNAKDQNCLVGTTATAVAAMSTTLPGTTYRDLERTFLCFGIDPHDSLDSERDVDSSEEAPEGGLRPGRNLSPGVDDAHSEQETERRRRGGENHRGGALREFAENYFNAHVIHGGGGGVYQNAISKTVNIVTRKSLNVCIGSFYTIYVCAIK